MRRRRDPLPSEPQQVVLVTGASSGIGLATVRLLTRRGLRVFGTSRRPMADDRAPGVSWLGLDVRSDASAKECVKAVVTSSGRVDVLVNNAGYKLTAASEEVSSEQARDLMETNLGGAVRRTNTVLPLMRRQRGGRIVNIGSLVGLLALPFESLYDASKFALEGYSEALRHELSPMGIHVSIVESGFVRTGLAGRSRTGARPLGDYAAARDRTARSVMEHEARGLDAEVVAAEVLRIIESESPRLRYRVGREAARFVQFRRWLPERTFERGLRREFMQVSPSSAPRGGEVEVPAE